MWEARRLFDWLRRRGSRGTLPNYSAVQKAPNRGLPSELAEEEASQRFSDLRDAVEQSLREPSRRPQAENPLFVGLLPVKGEGVITITPPDGVACLPIFSSPFRAADYVRTRLVSGPAVKYLASSPRELITLLQDLREIGIEQLVLDPCPRCMILTVITSASSWTPDKAIEWWSITRATQLARLDLYLNYARASARAGKLEAARAVLLETAGHVSFEDPRVHLLLGQIAVSLEDPQLLREAKTFLTFFGRDSWEQQLDQIGRTGAPDFEFPD
jgi:hypothetical protein